MLAGDSPSPRHQWEGQNRGEDRQTLILGLVSPPQPITMHLDCQGPAVTYSEAISRPPGGRLSPPLNWQSVMYDLRWQPMRKRRRLLEPPLNGFRDKNKRKRPLRRNRKSTSSAESGNLMPGVSWRRKELGGKKNTTMSEGPLEAVLTLLLTPWGWCEYEWSRKGTYESPAWAGDLWSASPMDHQQLAMRMVCSWGLVKAYQQTRQSTYVCPPAPHVIEAFNHKVNHNSHKELGTQEHMVLQYTHTLQYVSFCNDERYKDRLAPVVKAFWSEVAEPFGSRALRNLDLLHILGKAMCPNQGAKIPDYGVWDHIAQICTPSSRR